MIYFQSVCQESWIVCAQMLELYENIVHKMRKQAGAELRQAQVNL
jgi:hypothetical protein